MLAKYLVSPTVVLILVVILMTACGYENEGKGSKAFLLSWVVFHCWAIYFYSGCTVINGLRAIGNYMIGAFASIAIVAIIGALPPSYGAHAVTIACALVAFCLMFLAHIPFANNIPSTFCGASAFFALSAIGGKDLDQQDIVIRLFIGIVVGCILGWATVTLQTALTKALSGAPKKD